MAANDTNYSGLSAGIEIAVGVGLGYLAGTWIDNKFGIKPWGLFVCLMLGCAAGLYLVVKEANRAEAAEKRERDSKSREQDRG